MKRETGNVKGAGPRTFEREIPSPNAPGRLHLKICQGPPDFLRIFGDFCGFLRATDEFTICDLRFTSSGRGQGWRQSNVVLTRIQANPA